LSEPDLLVLPLGELPLLLDLLEALELLALVLVESELDAFHRIDSPVGNSDHFVDDREGCLQYCKRGEGVQPLVELLARDAAPQPDDLVDAVSICGARFSEVGDADAAMLSMLSMKDIREISI
jgi:hypothetical protein